MDATQIESASDDIARRWIWVLDIVFGATAAFGFENLQQSIRVASEISFDEMGKQIFVAASLYIFFLYDVTAVHIFTKKYQYKLSLLSGARYLLDIIMAFLLMLMLIPGVQTYPENSILLILVALSLWHLGAFAWHLLANIEHRKNINWQSFISHFIYISIYWIVFGIWYSIQWFNYSSVNYYSSQLLYAVCATVMLVALWRLNAILKLWKTL